MTETTSPTVSSSTNIRVVGRIRPLSSREKEIGSKETILSLNTGVDPEVCNDEPEMIQVNEHGRKRWFELDAVFDKNCTQKEVYLRSGAKKAVCEDIFKGFNCTLLAYGQTGAGKTYSMGTASHGTEIGEHDGIIPRVCYDLFENIIEKCDGHATVELSYLEIYNEELRDLIADVKPDKPLKIRETMNDEIYVAGLKKVEVTSAKEISDLMEIASKRRVVACTAMNAVSSRSHAMCILYVKGIVDGYDGVPEKFTSKLTLVDLAGSERSKKTGATGDRLKEGINVNKSLLVLGQVVAALSEKDNKKARMPPYRDSKLTRLLQDSLGGNSRTIFVACVSPADCNNDESINVLRYATNARNIRNSATRNVVTNISQEEAMKLQRDNALLKKQVKELEETIKLLTQNLETAISSPPSSTSSVVSNSSEGSKAISDTMDIGDSHRTFTSATSMETSVDTSVSVEIVGQPSFAITDNNGDKSTVSSGTDQTPYNDVKNYIAIIEQNNEQIKELEFQNERLRKSVSSSVVELPKLKAEVQKLREEKKQKDILEVENRRLHEELDLALNDAHCARRAAAKFSDMLEEFQDIKQITDEELDIEYYKEKEETMVSFVNELLENNKIEMKKVHDDFELVIQFVNNIIKSCSFSTAARQLGVDPTIRTEMLNTQVEFFTDNLKRIEQQIEDETKSFEEMVDSFEKTGFNDSKSKSHIFPTSIFKTRPLFRRLSWRSRRFTSGSG